MRGLLILLSTALMAQTPSAKPQASSPKPAAAAKSAPSKPAAARTKPAAAPLPMTDDEKTIYALGLSLSQSISQFDLSPSELAILQRAISDSAAGTPALNLNEWGPKIQPLAQARSAGVIARHKAESQAYLEKLAAEPGALKTESGLIFREVRPGSGASPKATDTVKVNYRGTLVNGTEFDSSYSRNEPAQFPLNAVIRCWTEGLQKMKVGGKAVLACPSDLAYGDQGRPSIPGGAALIFEVELLDIIGGTQ